MSAYADTSRSLGRRPNPPSVPSRTTIASLCQKRSGPEQRIGEGSPCHDFGGALRVTDGRSREGPRRSAAAGGAEGPTLTARRHARQSRRLRDRAPLLVIAALGRRWVRCVVVASGAARSRATAVGVSAAVTACEAMAGRARAVVGFGPGLELGVGEVGVELLAAGERGRLVPAVVEVVGEPIEQLRRWPAAEMDQRWRLRRRSRCVLSARSISSSAR